MDQVILRGNNLQSRRTRAKKARRLLSEEAAKPVQSPHRDQLTRQFSREVAAAVEAAIANRARVLVERTGKPAANGAARTAPLDERWPTLDEHQWSYIHRVLERTHGNKSEAAAMLGLHRRSLQRLLRRKKDRGRQAITRRGAAARAADPKTIVTGDGTIVLESLTFSEIERAILAWALRRHDGSGRQAARSLGLARSTFADKVNRYELKAARPSKRRGR
ncbi:MAG TPA: helix-turn-helix domain-containing protein [Polyangia bacterium]|nr:helix-turn-helix domain-containing protein [Polyangia bacterium]